MLPYNDDENAWISKNAISINNSIKCNFVFSLFLALFVTMFSNTVSPLTYFLRINLF